MVHPADQMGTTFVALDAKPRWRRRLPGLAAPTLVVHGADNRFVPVGNGEAIATAVPDATLLVLPGVGAELPARVHDQFAVALLDHTGG